MLIVRNLWAGYGEVIVLRKIDFEAYPSEVISILGPNGAGKSTLLRCLAGIVKPLRGQILVNGEEVTTKIIDRLSRIIGYVPQESRASKPLLTVLEYVLLGRITSLRTWRIRDEDLEAAYEALEMLGIVHLAEHRLDQLSGGLRQLVDIAQALAKRPRILLLDEPTSALDIKYQYEVMELIEDLTKKRKLVTIMIQHDPNIALDFSDKAILLHNGQIVAQGKPEDIITPDNIKKVYGVKAKIVYVDGSPKVILTGSRRRKIYESIISS